MRAIRLAGLLVQASGVETLVARFALQPRKCSIVCDNLHAIVPQTQIEMNQSLHVVIFFAELGFKIIVAPSSR